MTVLLKQRRRWINGTWFATLLYIKSYKKLYYSKHSRCRKIVLYLQIIYYCLHSVYSFLLVGGSYLAFSICVRLQLKSDTIPGNRNTTGNILVIFYLMQLVVLFIISLGTTLKHVEKTFYVISASLCLNMSIFIFLLVGIMMDNFSDLLLIISLNATAGSFVLVLFLNKCFFEIAQSIIHFLIVTPIYMNVFTIYALCNIHDVSWGNRGDSANEKLNDERKNEFKKYRAGWVLVWIYMNAFLVYLLDSVSASIHQYGLVVYRISFIGLAVLVFKFLFTLIYLACKCLGKCKGEQSKETEVRGRTYIV